MHPFVIEAYVQERHQRLVADASSYQRPVRRRARPAGRSAGLRSTLVSARSWVHHAQDRVVYVLGTPPRA